MRALSDDALLHRLSEALRQSRRVEADLVALIAEVDARKLYAREATPSMFVYCTQVLRLSEHEAYLRITVARAARKHPVLLAMLRDGRLHLAAIARLAPHLDNANHELLLTRAVHRSKREIEELVAEVSPRPDAVAIMRRLPAPRQGTQAATTARPGLDPVDSQPDPGPGAADTCPPPLGPDRVATVQPELGQDRDPLAGQAGRPERPAAPPAPPPTRSSVVEPLAPARYKVQFTASAELHDKLERLQALMRSSVPDGDLGAVIEAAVTATLERLEAQRFARTKAPRKTLAQADPAPVSRHIPAPIRRAVYERDKGRCTYEDARGRRCPARDRLEFHHHARPFGRGGEHSLQNIRLMCHTHNQLLADRDYGSEKMNGHRRAARRVSEATPAYGVRTTGLRAPPVTYGASQSRP